MDDSVSRVPQLVYFPKSYHERFGGETRNTGEKVETKVIVSVGKHEI